MSDVLVAAAGSCLEPPAAGGREAAAPSPRGTSRAAAHRLRLLLRLQRMKIQPKKTEYESQSVASSESMASQCRPQSGSLVNVHAAEDSIKDGTSEDQDVAGQGEKLANQIQPRESSASSGSTIHMDHLQDKGIQSQNGKGEECPDGGKRGEVMTVRVPTHPDGKRVCWEFATDDYDIGFGVYFDWTPVTSTAITVQVSESSDEDDEEEEDAVEGLTPVGDVERGTKSSLRNRYGEIMPVYRRDSHRDVQAGSHDYPGEGIYLLKFDNSYSLLRNKTLFFHVYYTS